MRTLPEGKSKEKALVAGSYDPVTLGHISLIEEAARHFEEVYAVIFVNKEKTYMFSVEERLELLKIACSHLPNVQVDFNDGMQYIYAKQKGITVAIRGYRNEKDYLYEKEIAKFNIEHNPSFDTLLLPSEKELLFVESRKVRELLSEGKSPASFLTPEVEKKLFEFLESRRK